MFSGRGDGDLIASSSLFTHISLEIRQAFSLGNFILSGYHSPNRPGHKQEKEYGGTQQADCGQRGLETRAATGSEMALAGTGSQSGSPTLTAPCPVQVVFQCHHAT